MSGWRSFGSAPGEQGIASHEVEDLLVSLIEKNLVVMDPNGRYRLLETIRHLGQAYAVERGEEATLRDRHLRYCASLAAEAATQLNGAGQPDWLDRLETEHDNLRAALELSLQQPSVSGSQLGLSIVESIWLFWEIRGYLAEGRDWCSAILGMDADSQDPTTRARVLNGAGVLAWQQGDYRATRALMEESLAIVRQHGGKEGVARLSNNLGIVAYAQGDLAGARTLHEESLATYRDLDNPEGIAMSLGNLGNVAHDQGDFVSARALQEESLAIKRRFADRRAIAGSANNLGIVVFALEEFLEARVLYEESLEIYRELGDRTGIAASLCNLGLVAAALREDEAARELLGESLESYLPLGNKQGLAESLKGLATVAFNSGDLSGAARCWGAAERIREEIGLSIPSIDRQSYDQQLESARASLGAARFDAAWKEGRNSTGDQLKRIAIGCE